MKNAGQSENGKNAANAPKAGRPSFFSGLMRGIVQNLPLLLAGGLLLAIGWIFDVQPVRFIAYSLFIAYLLCCSFQAFYGLSSKSLLRANEPSKDEKDEKDEKGGKTGGVGPSVPEGGDGPASPPHSDG